MRVWWSSGHTTVLTLSSSTGVRLLMLLQASLKVVHNVGDWDASSVGSGNQFPWGRSKRLPTNIPLFHLPSFGNAIIFSKYLICFLQLGYPWGLCLRFRVLNSSTELQRQYSSTLSRLFQVL